MKNIKNINMIISTLCLIMMMIFVGTAAILSSHNKIGDSKDDISYSTTASKTTTTSKTTKITTTTTSTTTESESTTETTTTTTTSKTTKITTTTTSTTTESESTTETTTTYITTVIEFAEVTYQELELTNITVVETYTEAVNCEQTEPTTEEPVVSYYTSACDKVTYYGNYGYAAVGASGNVLITGYSCACDLYPFGTILYVETSDGAFAGYVRVDDRVSGGNSTIVDIYYESYDMVPYSMYNAGSYTTYYINEWHPTCLISVVG